MLSVPLELLAEESKVTITTDSSSDDAIEIKDGGTSQVPTQVTLAESLKLAASRNLDLQRANQSVEKQRARVVEVRGALFPVISANGNTSWLDEGRRFSFGNGQKPNSNTWQGNIQLDQPIFQGGKAFSAKSVEDSLYEAIRFQYQGIRNEVAYQVYNTYFRVLLSRELLKVREEAVSLLQDELVKAQRKFNVGTISNFDVTRAEVSLANARTPLIQARNSLSIALEELKRVLNIDIDRELLNTRVSDSLKRTWDTIDAGEAATKAKEQNPEIKRLYQVMLASEHGVDFQRANFLPSLNFSANYGVERTAFVPKNFEGWQAGLNLKWTLFDSFQTVGRVEQAQAELKSAKMAWDKAKLDTDIEVQRALSSVTEARALVDVSSKVIGQAQDSYRLAQNRFDAGGVTQLDVLAQRLELTEALSNSAQAYYSQNVAEAQLRRSMGILGEELQIPEEKE